MKVSVEVQFAQRLAGNEKKERDRAVKKLKQWLSMRTAQANALTNDEMMRIWKGLFYCYWMSDKPLVQEELAENIASFIGCFGNEDATLMFIQCFFLTLGREWFGIDRWRMDKFMMMVRRFVRQIFKFNKKQSWDRELASKLQKVIHDSLLFSKTKDNSLGLQLHITDLYLEELAKVGGEELPKDILQIYLEPYFQVLASCREQRFRSHVIERIFHHLIRQSDPGIEWELNKDIEELGYKEEQIENGEPHDDVEEDEEMEELVEDDNGVGNQAEDPRAGRVDVELPQLPLDYEEVANKLFEIGSRPEIMKANRKDLYLLSKYFKDVANNVFPLGEGLEDLQKIDVEKVDIKKSVQKAMEREEKYRKKNLKRKEEYKKWQKEERKKLRLQSEDVSEDKSEDEADSQEEAIEDEDSNEPDEKRMRMENGTGLGKKEREKKRKQELKRRKRERLLAEKLRQEEAEKLVQRDLELKAAVDHWDTVGKVTKKEKKKKKEQAAETSISNNHVNGLSEESPISKKEKKKQKKEKKKMKNCEERTNEADIESSRSSTKQKQLLEVTEPVNASAGPVAVQNGETAPEVNGKKKNKKKKKNKDKADANDSVTLTMVESFSNGVEGTSVWETSLSTSPKGAKAASAGKLFEEAGDWDAPLQDGELEIVLPNKKYKGKLKLEPVKGSEEEEIVTPKKKKKRSIESASPSDGFPGFSNPTVSTPNPAKSHTAQFLRKAMSKSSTPQPKKAAKEARMKEVSASEPKKKKVNFVLTMNKSQNFEDFASSILNSPGVPHDPNKNPEKSLLKKKESMENLVNLNPVQLNTQLNSRSKAAKIIAKQRMNAAQFFI